MWWPACLRLLLAVAIILPVSPVATVEAATSVKVDPTLQYQEFEGFGTSLSWFANVIGGWSEPTRTEIVDLLFDPVDGIGINVLRYNIGGGDHPEQDWLRTGADVPGYQPEEGVWDWTQDANQRWVLEAAQQRLGSDLIVEAYSNSPPYWMTYSNTSTGHFDGGQENLKPEYFDAFADYLTEVVKHFHDHWNITFKTLEPFNEPHHTWWQAYNNQEGTYFTVESQMDLIDRISQSLAQKGLSTGIAAMNNTNFGTTLQEWRQYDEDIKDKVIQINAHGYYGSTTEMRQLSSKAASRGKDLWVAEADGSGGTDPFGPAPNGFEPFGMTPSLNLTAMMNTQLKEAQPTAWVFWQAVENWVGNITGNHNWGLIVANFEGQGVEGLDEEAYLVTKKYYTYGQYSKFIRPGFRQIEIGHPDAVAFLDSDGGRLIIVQTHRGSSAETYDYDLSGFDTTASYAEVHRTDANHNLERLADTVISNGILSVNMPAESITTLVIDGVTYTNGPPVFDPNIHYRIENRNSGKSLSVGGLNKNKGAAPIQQFTDEQQPHQRWLIVDTGRGYHQIINVDSGQLMDIDGESTANGALNIQWPNNHQSNQQWQIVDIGDGYFKLINRNSGKLLDMSDESMDEGGQSIQWEDNGGWNQHWKIVPSPVEVPVNLALNRPVQYSSQQAGNEAVHLVDGSSDTRWAAEGYEQWVEIDLGEIREVERVEIVPFEDRAYQYKIETSTDQVHYTLAVDRSSNTEGKELLTDVFAPVQARYVRLTVTGAHQYDGGWVSLHEFRIFGSE